MKKFYMPGFKFLVTLLFGSLQVLAQNPQNGVTIGGYSSGAIGSDARGLYGPRGIFVDISGSVYVSDHFNNRIQKFEAGPNNNATTVAPLPSSSLQNSAADVFLDAAGTLFISDDLGTRILEYKTGVAGRVLIQGAPVPGQVNSTTLNSPYGIFVDKSLNVYVTDGTARGIVKFVHTLDTTFTPGVRVSPPGADSYNDVFVDAAGNIYGADISNNRVLKFTAGATTGVVVAGGNGPGPAPNQLNRPQGIFVDTAGNVYVADLNNNRIQKWAPGATAGITVAGGNGAGAAANQLNMPWSVEVDKAGNIYVADNGNNRIQKFVPGSGLAYKYYEGIFSALPDFNSISAIKSGITANTDISIRTAGRSDNFAFIWEGFIKIATPGTYTFETVSDDGSKVYFNTSYNTTATALVNNDGLHAATSATGTVYIPQAGVYPIAITYFEKDGGEQMQTYWTGPGIARQQIPDVVFTQVPPTTTPPPATGSLNYKYYEGGFSMMPDFSTLAPVNTGTSTNFDINIHRAGVTDSFAIVWDGFINIPAAGSYTFETISDDGSQLFFNGALLVNNDGLHPPKSEYGTINIPAAGRYPIKVAYFETYGAESLQVFWSGPGFARQLIPDPAFEAGGTIPPTAGLNYKYYLGDFNVLPDFNALTPARTGIGPNVNISLRDPGVDDHFAFLWQGYINLPSAGNYTFETVSDDGSKVYFNTPYSATSNGLVNNDGLHAAVSATGSVTVPAAGSYPITIAYFEKDGGQSMQLFYSGPGIARQIIPDGAFSATGTPPASNGGLGYKYYEGVFDVLPNFNTLAPIKTGTSSNVDISERIPGVDDHFAFLWQGYINIPTAGMYTFETVSDDGSKLYFNTLYNPAAVPTVSNDGLHAPASITGNVNIAAAGSYPISITFFEKEGGQTMEVYWSGPGFSRQMIPNSAFTQTAPGAIATAPDLNRVASDAISKEPSAVTRIYPNPFSETFNIELVNSSVANDIQVGIYDLKGRLLYLKKAGKMPVGNITVQVKPGANLLPRGIYMARLQVNGMPLKVVKLVKLK